MKNHHSVRIRNQSAQQNTSRKDGHSAGPKLLELMALRVAQIHQCLPSIQIHMEKLRSMGETERRLQHLETWATSELFDVQERAALAFCEKITLNPAQPLLDSLIQEMRHYFTKAAIVSLTLAIMAVNDWVFMGGP